MASRKEQKEALRRERQERERRAREAERRKRLVGYGIGGVLALAAVAILVAVVATAGGGGDGGSGGEGFPSEGEAAKQRITDLRPAARAAGCELRSFPGEPPEHTADPNERVDYNSNPPTNGRHFGMHPDDGAYAKDPGVVRVVHALEHGRVIWWFKPSLAARVKADLKALFDQDNYQLIITAYSRPMPYEVAASAWNGQPEPNGTGRLLGCPRANARAFDALRAFRDEHRGNGLEPVP